MIGLFISTAGLVVLAVDAESIVGIALVLAYFAASVVLGIVAAAFFGVRGIYDRRVARRWREEGRDIDEASREHSSGEEGIGGADGNRTRIISLED